MREKTSTTNLPKSLREQIDALDQSSVKTKSTKPLLDRKARRRLERQSKPVLKRQQISSKSQFSKATTLRPSTEPSSKRQKIDRITDDALAQSNSVKSILKKKPKSYPEPIPETEPVVPVIRKAIRDKLEEDDDEIARLERKLKIKGRKLPKSFSEDGLDFLLEGLDDSLGGGTDKDEDKLYLAEKRNKKRKHVENVPGQLSTDLDGSDDSVNDGLEIDLGEESDDVDDFLYSDKADDTQEEWVDRDNESSEEGEEDDGESSLDGDDLDESTLEAKRAPESSSATLDIYGRSMKSNATIPTATKYIPPSLRKLSASEDESLAVLRRKVQGQLNRLSDANVLQIVAGLEELYRNNPRQNVTSTITDLILTSITDKATLFDTFLILHAGLVAALYRIIGIDFGAHVIQTVTEQFEICYNTSEENATSSDAVNDTGKKANNLMGLLLELYNFGVISSVLIFGLIRIFVAEMNELNTELLLKVVRNSGSQLRQDDPTSLKDIVTMMHPAISRAGLQNLSTRTRFMIETLTNLKNNKSKLSTATTVVNSESSNRMRKTLGSLNSRQLRTSEPLRASLNDIRQVETKGKWWLVGASWKNDTEADDTPAKTSKKSLKNDEPHTDDIEDLGVTDLLQMAREQRMNTDIRRAIFVSIMSSEDYSDASERLQKLRLKRSQEREIPRVLLHCCGSEQLYNHYYTLIASELCTRHSSKMTFQFCLWELFRNMGEEDEMSVGEFEKDDEDIEEQIPVRKMVNLAKMYGSLVANGSLPLTVLKTLKLSSLQTRTKTFLELFFITIFVNSQKQPLSKHKRDDKKIRMIFSSLADLRSTARGTSYFLKKYVKNTDVAGGEEETQVVKWGCTVAESVLRNIGIGEAA